MKTCCSPPASFDTDSDGNKLPKQVTLRLWMKRTAGSTVAAEIKDCSGEGFAATYTPLSGSSTAETDDGEYQQLTLQGEWDGTGTLYITVTGTAYIHTISLEDDAIATAAVTQKTLFEQTDKYIKAVAANFDEDGNVLAESSIVTTTEMNKVVSTYFEPDTGELVNKSGLVTTAAGSGIYAQDADGNITLIGVSSDGKIKLSGEEIQLEGAVTANGNVKINEDGTLEAVNGKFSGTLSGVTGTFEKLSALDSSGNEQGAIYFSASSSHSSLVFDFDGIAFNIGQPMYINSGDLYMQGQKSSRMLRFYSQSIWCRGSFGARERNVVYINGTTAYYYVNGYGTSSSYYVSKSLTAKTDSNGNTYYTVSCYGATTLDAGWYDLDTSVAGFPVDTVVIKQSSGTMYYDFDLDPCQKLTVINANDDYNNVYVYTHGGKSKRLDGGLTMQLMNVPWLSPTTDEELGQNILILSYNDYDW